MAEKNPEDETSDEASAEIPEAGKEPDREQDQELDQDGAADESEATASDPLADAAVEIANLQDRALRAQAELENVRRRAARDVENAHKYALENFAADLLPVLDSLEKAVEATVGAGAEDARTLGEGVELSLKLFLSTCEKAGLSQVDPHGEPFDPQLHEAIAMVPNPDAEPNSVMEVMQKGYTLNGRLVRAARVVVVQGEDKQDS
ncbi:MAG: nucleotide exchange factor GrpE [Pseudomonadales bacterium]